MLAEKSGNGYEESWCKGPDHDDIGLVGLVHFPIFLSLPYLVSVNVLFVYGKGSHFLFGNTRLLISWKPCCPWVLIDSRKFFL